MANQKRVNWVDGMSLSHDHFVQTEEFMIGSMCDVAQLGITNYNFGLLPSRSEHNLYNGIRISEHVTGHIEVQLYSCNAVTASGLLVSFDAEDNGGEPLLKNYSPAEDKNIRNRDIKHWDVILSVDPFSRIAFGEPDPQEVPPRQPDCRSEYSLYVMPAGELDSMQLGRHYLTIGRIRKDGDRYVVDTNYIPPSTSMSSHPELADYYNTFSMLLNSVEKSSKSIVAKIHERSNKAELAINLNSMCRDLLQYISGIYFSFRNKGRQLPPIEVVDYISSLAHTCYVSLTMLSGKQKEELLKYFFEWTDVSPGSFEEMLAQMLETIYKHDDIRSVMVQSENFMRTFSELWERMSRLEFIGQHKESIIISERSQERNNSAPDRSWSPVD